VDTVALERVRAGIYTPLRPAEKRAITDELLAGNPDLQTQHRIAEGLGIHPHSVRRRLIRARKASP
jgi:hypothetical protein